VFATVLAFPVPVVPGFVRVFAQLLVHWPVGGLADGAAINAGAAAGAARELGGGAFGFGTDDAGGFGWSGHNSVILGVQLGTYDRCWLRK